MLKEIKERGNHKMAKQVDKNKTENRKKKA